MEIESDNFKSLLDAVMSQGAKVQRFYDEWKDIFYEIEKHDCEDDNEERLIKSIKLQTISDILDDFSITFQDIIQ
jgi:hypothetical protein